MILSSSGTNLLGEESTAHVEIFDWVCVEIQPTKAAPLGRDKQKIFSLYTLNGINDEYSKQIRKIE